MKLGLNLDFGLISSLKLKPTLLKYFDLLGGFLANRINWALFSKLTRPPDQLRILLRNSKLNPRNISTFFFASSLIPPLLALRSMDPWVVALVASSSLMTYYSVFPTVVHYIYNKKLGMYAENAYLAIQYFILGLTHKPSFAALLMAKSNIPPYNKELAEIYWEAKVNGKSLAKELREYARNHPLRSFGACMRGIMENPSKVKVYDEALREEMHEKTKMFLKQLQSRITLFTSYSLLYVVGLSLMAAVGSLKERGQVFMLSFYLISLFTLFRMLFLKAGFIVRIGEKKELKLAAELLWSTGRLMKQGLSPARALMEAVRTSGREDLWEEVKGMAYGDSTFSKVLGAIGRRIKALKGPFELIAHRSDNLELAEILHRLGDSLMESFRIQEEIGREMRARIFDSRVMSAIFGFVAPGFLRVVDYLPVGSARILPAVSLVAVIANTLALCLAVNDRLSLWGPIPICIYAISKRYFWEALLP